MLRLLASAVPADVMATAAEERGCSGGGVCYSPVFTVIAKMRAVNSTCKNTGINEKARGFWSGGHWKREERLAGIFRNPEGFSENLRDSGENPAGFLFFLRGFRLFSGPEQAFPAGENGRKRRFDASPRRFLSVARNGLRGCLNPCDCGCRSRTQSRAVSTFSHYENIA